MPIKRLISSIIVITTTLLNLWPFAPLLAAPNESSRSVAAVAPSTVTAALPAPDWSAVDWDEEIVLAKDFEKTREQREELLRAGKSAAAAALTAQKHRRGDDDVMQSVGVPVAIQEAVRQYRGEAQQLRAEGARIETISAEKER